MMLRAIALGEKARLHAPPNPWVGCVIAKEGRIVGEGFTQPPGSNHAEIEALNQAKEHARGADLYVTLEPCVHEGRTGPCAAALINAGIRRCFVALEDPDPKVSGKGIAHLREANIDVEIGLEAEKARASLTPYLHQRKEKRPYCWLKVGMSLDGMVADQQERSQWITCEEARRDAHILRSQSQVVLVGAKTRQTDLPSLNVRYGLPCFRQPRSIVLEKRKPLLPLLERLATEGVLQLLVEGGPTVFASFFREGFVDRFTIYQAPLLLGPKGKSVMGEPWPWALEDAPRFQLVAQKQCGECLRFDYVSQNV